MPGLVRSSKIDVLMMFDGMEAKWNFVWMFSRADRPVHRARLQTNVHGRTGIDCSARWLPASHSMNNFDLMFDLSCTCNTKQRTGGLNWLRADGRRAWTH